ncbi:hypothetical protein FPQ18DRAFT_399410 [Pyronema domesticum]|nr:hypothetical protein FPQ18DRAFT_399410 [Pyronema domesticum]
MRYLHASLLLILSLASLSASTHNSTKLEDTFVAEPKRRGIIQLLRSCAVTYGICNWTAVHKDLLPFARIKDRHAYKILWILTALTFPEFLLIVAGAFFLVMGGYTIKRHIGTEEKPDVVIALTQAGLEKLIGFGEWGKSWVIEDRPERKQSFFQSAISKLQGVCVFGSKASSPKDLEKLAPDHPEQIKKQNLQEYLEEDERTTCSFASTEPSDTTNEDESLLPPPFGIDSTRPSSETTRTLVPEQTQQVDDITIASLKIPVKTQIFETDLTSCYSHSMPVVIESSDLSKDRHNIGYRMCHLVFSNFAYDSRHSSEFNGMALSAINTGLHAIAWNSHFPTKSEEVLWKKY